MVYPRKSNKFTQILQENPMEKWVYMVYPRKSNKFTQLLQENPMEKLVNLGYQVQPDVLGVSVVRDN